jgi:phosphohistidine phosphatase
MRHGEAESTFESDETRNLTRRGENDVIEMATQLGGKMDLNLIVASPYLRAKQTARLFAKGLGLKDLNCCWDELTPSGQPSIVLDKIAILGITNLLVVTHQPFISRVIEYLTGVETGMGTASVVAIQLEHCVEGGGEIQWLRHRH